MLKGASAEEPRIVKPPGEKARPVKPKSALPERVPTLAGLGPPAGAADLAPASRRGREPRPSSLGAARRAAHSYRFVRAYWTTFLVIGSYLWFGFLSRLLGKSWADEHVAEVHTRNARRVERTIVKLQGLFIKVGQLLSIMANFLPAQFRSGLEALQDQVPPHPYGEIEGRIREELGKEGVLDMGMPKPKGELLINGTAFVPGGAPRILCKDAIEWLGIDLYDTQALAQAAQGASVVVHALSPAYTHKAWREEAPALMEAAIAVSRQLRATLMLPGNVYNFGESMPPVLREDTPQAATGFKGRMRVQLEQRLQAATQGGEMRAVVLRAGTSLAVAPAAGSTRPSPRTCPGAASPGPARQAPGGCRRAVSRAGCAARTGRHSGPGPRPATRPGRHR